eukprot:g928.t1
MKRSVADWVEAFGGIWMADGAELLLISSVTKALADEWDLTNVERGSVVSIVFIGVLFGNLLSGKLGDLLGRRIPILLSYGCIFLFSLASAMAVDFYTLICLRFFVGAAFGLGQPSAGALAAEIMPAAWRIFPQVCGQAMFPIGEMYSGFLVAIDDPQMRDLDWRWLITMGALPSIVLGLYAYYELYESPLWLATQPGRQSEAVRMLEKIRAANYVPEGADKLGSSTMSFNGIVRSVSNAAVAMSPTGTASGVTAHVNYLESQTDEAAASGMPPGRTSDTSVFSATISETNFEGCWTEPIELKDEPTPKPPTKAAANIVDDAEQQQSFSPASPSLFRFSPQYIGATFTLCWTTFTLNFVYYGGLYAFPQLLEGIGDTLTVSPAVSLMLAALCEIPGCVIALLLGLYCFRKPSMMLSLLLCCLSTGLFVAGASMVAKSEKEQVVKAIAEPAVPGYSPPVPGVEWSGSKDGLPSRGGGKEQMSAAAAAGAVGAGTSVVAPQAASSASSADGGSSSTGGGGGGAASTSAAAGRRQMATAKAASNVKTAPASTAAHGKRKQEQPPQEEPPKNVWDEKTHKFRRSGSKPGEEKDADKAAAKAAEEKKHSAKKYVATVAGPVYKGTNATATSEKPSDSNTTARAPPPAVAAAPISTATVSMYQQHYPWLVQFFNLGSAGGPQHEHNPCAVTENRGATISIGENSGAGALPAVSFLETGAVEIRAARSRKQAKARGDCLQGQQAAQVEDVADGGSTDIDRGPADDERGNEDMGNFLLQIGLFGNKIWVQVSFVIVYLYSVEAYPTEYRNTGAAACLATGRLGAITCPLVYELLPHQFYFFFILSDGENLNPFSWIRSLRESGCLR